MGKDRGLCKIKIEAPDCSGKWLLRRITQWALENSLSCTQTREDGCSCLRLRWLGKPKETGQTNPKLGGKGYSFGIRPSGLPGGNQFRRGIH